MKSLILKTTFSRNKYTRLYTYIYLLILKKIKSSQNRVILLNEESQEAMSLLFRRNFQLVLLDTLNVLGKGAYASEIQSNIFNTEGEKLPSLGAIVMSLSRLHKKGLVSYTLCNSNNRSTDSNKRRRYVITLAGRRELDKFLSSFKSRPERKVESAPEAKGIAGTVPT